MRKVLLRCVSVVLLVLVLLTPHLATAQNAAKQGQGLEISPPLLDLAAKPGESIKTTIKIRNITKGPLIVKEQVNDFVASGEDGQPNILLEDGEESPYSIKGWVKSGESLRIEPNEQKKYPISISVPNNAGPGGHYGVVRFTGTPPNLDDTGVSLSASVGSLVLIRVAGDVVEGAKITELYTQQGDKRRSLFEYGPVTIVQKIENTGNTHFKPRGTVRVLNMFGKEVKTYQINENDGNVLPASTRKFEQNLESKLLLGRFKIQSDVVYGSDSQIVSASTSFWVIPYKLIAILIAVIAVLIFGIRKYNKFIVKRARKSQK